MRILTEKRPPIAITPNEKVQPTFEAMAIGAGVAHGWEGPINLIKDLADREPEENTELGHKDMQ
jgi:hypothetical protein